MNVFYSTALVILALGTAGCSNQSNQGIQALPEESQGWEQLLSKQIELLGHRNWIVVVDAAYPLQSSPGITTLTSDLNHLATIEKVMAVIDEQAHIRPVTYLDMEIDYVEEADANGITAFRNDLSILLGSDPPQKLLHELIIQKLDDASKQFSVLIIKTDFTLPYTSVFFQLDCKYWDDDSEMELRRKIAGQ